MTLSIEFRKLNISDMIHLSHLYFQEENIEMGDTQIQQFESKMEEVYTRIMLRSSYIYGCFNDDNLLAVITVNKCLELYPGYTDNPYVHLETFIVDKRY